MKASINIQADSLEDAIVFLSQRFLRATKTGCRIVQTPTDVSVADVCQPLIDGWMGKRVAYGKGKVVLVFRSGQLTLDADMLIYTPKEGDRFLYTKPHLDHSPPSASSSPHQPSGQSHILFDPGHSNANPQSLTRVSDQLRALDHKLDALFMLAQTEQKRVKQQETVRTQSHSEENADDAQRWSHWQQQTTHYIGEYIREYLEQQMSLQIQQHLVIALDPVLQQLDDLQDQVETLTDYVAELDIAAFDSSPPIPTTEDEWIDRIMTHWGTVGDYEKYSPSYRDTNAEAPLHETPDWIALCESDWSWKLCPTLATLYELIRGSGGIGDAGADILQQFGQHVDSKTEDTYYLYQLSGYTSLEALQQIAYHPDHSWLPELTRLWMLLADSNHPIFQLFGWEPDAIVALEHLVSNQASYGTDYESQWSTQSSHYQDPTDYSSGRDIPLKPTLRDYQALLNLGPFTPITVETIKRAYREAMKKAHPDRGGSTEYAQNINEAYGAVMAHYFPEISPS